MQCFLSSCSIIAHCHPLVSFHHAYNSVHSILQCQVMRGHDALAYPHEWSPKYHLVGVFFFYTTKSNIIVFSNGFDPTVIGNSTIPMGVNRLPSNHFKDVFVHSDFKSAIPISSKVDLKNISTELRVSTNIRWNSLPATVALITSMSSWGYKTPSSSSSVHMIELVLPLLFWLSAN